jgi:hypothetical protein
MVLASRRALERDVVGLIRTHSLLAVIHALIEACHRYIPRGPNMDTDRWEEVCMYLRAAEDVAQRLRFPN